MGRRDLPAPWIKSSDAPRYRAGVLMLRYLGERPGYVADYCGKARGIPSGIRPVFHASHWRPSEQSGDQSQ